MLANMHGGIIEQHVRSGRGLELRPVINLDWRFNMFSFSNLKLRYKIDFNPQDDQHFRICQGNQ